MAKYLVPCGSLNMLSEVWKVSDTLALEPVARTRNGAASALDVSRQQATLLSQQAALVGRCPG